eukprot:CAMPEP_0185023352 /NCGR_PEP_ID=MMETSP1103-20130426/6033_1 /TAXON_ID=36769 /ORGANISM="Paraphysomonas bandaiensis, Strain Caron Lab Isolate" /LENGTH=617 /DNA_ID=CAMNT_0027555909 /DNA_START=95 /DNA_END=1945 /DNA_ORIENTATION=-
MKDTTNDSDGQSNSLEKRIGQWQRLSRVNWEWKHRPSHRRKTIDAVLKGESLAKSLKDDFSSLEEVEKGLAAMSSFVASENRYEQDVQCDVAGERIDVVDCMQLVNKAREKAKRAKMEAKSKIVEQTPERPKPRPLSGNAMGNRKPPLLDTGEDATARPSLNCRQQEQDLTFLTGVDVGTEEEHLQKEKSPKIKAPKRSVSAGASRPRSSQASVPPPTHAERPPKPLPAPGRLAERQLEWLMRVESEKRLARMERETEAVRELHHAPDVSRTQESWERAKREHARQISREQAREAMQQKMEAMREEMRALRIEEKAMRLRCYETEARLLQKQNQQSRRRKKPKKKKRRSRSRSAPVESASSEPTKDTKKQTGDALDLVLSPEPSDDEKKDGESSLLGRTLVHAAEGKNSSRSDDSTEESSEIFAHRIRSEGNWQRSWDEESTEKSEIGNWRRNWNDEAAVKSEAGNWRRGWDGQSAERVEANHVDDSIADSCSLQSDISNLTDRTGHTPAILSEVHRRTTDFSYRPGGPTSPPSAGHGGIAWQPRVKFFDASSTADKGRHRVNDARDFDTKTMYRKTDILNSSVTLLMGQRRNSAQVEIITVLFDRSEFSEDGAKKW